MQRLALHWQILIGMIVGAGIGLTLNGSSSEQRFEAKSEILKAHGADEITFYDSTNRIEIHVKFTDQDPIDLVVDGTRKEKDDYPTLKELAKDEDNAAAYKLFQQYGRSRARWVGDMAQSIGVLFLRMLKMVSVPLIVTSLITGVMSVSSAGKMGSMFGKTVTYYICTSLLAIIVGLSMVNLIQPGIKPGEIKKDLTDKPAVSGDLGDVIYKQVETIIPSNPLGALTQPNFLSIISFSLAFAVFAVLIGGKTASTIQEFFSAGFEVMMAMTMAIIKLAPIGVMFLMLNVTATQGAEVFKMLGWYMLAVFFALAIHACIVLPLILKFVAKRDPLEFARAMTPALLTAFSSASSNATLPLTMASVEERAGVRNRVGSFVLPLGATVNMDGTALYEAVAVLFIAQLHFGHNLPLDQQLIVAFTALLASIGAAGIPHAGLVMMVIILQAVGLPLEMQGIIIAVDRVLDMCRTSVNVWSDSCGCAVVDRFESDEEERTSKGKNSKRRK